MSKPNDALRDAHFGVPNSRKPLVPKLRFGNAFPETPFRVRFPHMTRTRRRI